VPKVAKRLLVADADGEHIPVEREFPSPFNAFCWRFPLHLSLLGIFLTSVQETLLSSRIMIHMDLVAVLDVRYRQRVQRRLTRLRKRLLAFVIKANPECFDRSGRLAPGCFPARIPPEAASLHGLMRRAECKLAMIRCHAACRHCF